MKIHFHFCLFLFLFLSYSSAAFAAVYVQDFPFKTFIDSATVYRKGVNWTLDTDGALARTFSEVGLHYGTGESPISFLELSTTDFDKTISSVKVKVDCGPNKAANLKINVGGQDYKSGDSSVVVLKTKDYVVKERQNFTFTGSSSGELRIRLFYDTPTTNALYFYQVEVTYNDGTEDVIRLDEAVDNSTAITKAVSSGKQAVELHRTLSPDYWNTFCVPFAISTEAITSTFGGAEIREFSGRVEDGAMIFTKVDTIKAGVPYLLKPNNKVENPKFGDVAFTASVPSAVNDVSGKYAYVGIYSPYTMETDGTEQFLGDGGRLLKPLDTDRTIPGMRAYFRLPAAQAQAKIAITDVPTAITLPHAQSSRSAMKKGVYTIGGQYVGKTAQGLPQGIYIVDGQKIAIE
jgi:hypothetical protein